MSTPRSPRWELVGHHGAFHVRFRASNGQVIVSSENYKRKRDALKAIEIVTGQLYSVNGFLIDTDTLSRIEVRDMSGEAPLRPRRRVT